MLGVVLRPRSALYRRPAEANIQPGQDGAEPKSTSRDLGDAGLPGARFVPTCALGIEFRAVANQCSAHRVMTART
jgi:hypothetical protein